MGSIYGIFSRKGETLPAEKLSRMCLALSHRQYDEKLEELEGSFVSGSLAKKFKNHSINSVGKSRSVFRSLFIAGDLRLDNSIELRGMLSVDDQAISDHDLVLRSYRFWGVDCVNHLIGDFSFVIYDSENQEVFCARDHFGVKPFYYCLDKDNFVFGSEPGALFASGFLKKTINSSRNLDFLLRRFFDKELTYYQGVLRLPPAHCLVVSRKGVRKYRYWKLNAQHVNHDLTDEEAANEFRSLFAQAVASRMDRDVEVGAFLSGGLDSSSVASLARIIESNRSKRAFPVFSVVFPNVPASDETVWINSVLDEDKDQLNNFEPFSIRGDLSGPIEVIDDVARILGEPCVTPNLYQTLGLIELAREAGVEVLLTGHDGDSVVSHGFGHLTELALQQDWNAVELYLNSLSGTLSGYQQERSALLRYYVQPAVGVHFSRLRIFRSIKSTLKLNQCYGVPFRRIFADEICPNWLRVTISALRRQRRTPAKTASNFVRRFAVWRRRVAGTTPRFCDAVTSHIAGLETDLMAQTFEMFDKINAVTGVECRHPFFDKRLVEFCVSLPPKQKIGEGRTRHVLRNAMKGILSEEVRLRRDKSNLGHNLARCLLRDAPRFASIIHNPSKGAEVYWDLTEVERMWDRYLVTPNESDAFTLFLFASQNAWLRTLDK